MAENLMEVATEKPLEEPTPQGGESKRLTPAAAHRATVPAQQDGRGRAW